MVFVDCLFHFRHLHRSDFFKIFLCFRFFAIRHGPSWGFLAGFAFGGLDYILNYGIAIDWTTILCDYFLAYGFLGLGA
ncbi:MAG: energy-coupled thiamine transporter ThiT, partial [Oscillospiraceae bacterium]|nr:energy-coupled thiamine transporter ThiT [Oscillospiraceae bacterium]